jgi:hypothetical protein
VHLADLVRDTGVEQDTLSRRRLPGIDMRDDTDIAEHVHGFGAGHMIFSKNNIYDLCVVNKESRLTCHAKMFEFPSHDSSFVIRDS